MILNAQLKHFEFHTSTHKLKNLIVLCSLKKKYTLIIEALCNIYTHKIN